MTSAIFRKIGRVAEDPTLRRWLIGRALGRYKAPADFAPHCPPYVEGMLPLSAETPSDNATLSPGVVGVSDDWTAATLCLPGRSMRVQNNARLIDAFTAEQEDIERYLSLHRFAWTPFLSADEQACVPAFWTTWCEAFLTSDAPWIWHPYTATERALNIMDWSERFGWPGRLAETIDALALHALKIAAGLEYFGDHDTSNHLANNGRGLYRIGARLELPKARQLGFEILRCEAERIFLPSGVLREGSSHYHLLYARNYADVWLAAERHGHEEEALVLKDIASRALAVVPRLTLSGGLPLVGDISPDSPPSHVIGIESGSGSWATMRNDEDRQRTRDLAMATPPPSEPTLAADGWVRKEYGPWSALWYASPAGWPFMPGHGHQDIGGCEIHYIGLPVFIDPGRGGYGETGDAARYRSSAVHGTLRLNNQDPYPANKPYYTEVFRDDVCGDAPSFELTSDSVSLRYTPYREFGIANISRRWTFQNDGFELTDLVDGKRRQTVERSLVTPLDAEIVDSVVVLRGRDLCVTVTPSADATIELDPVTRWHAYGEGTPATRIVFNNQNAAMPWSGNINIEVTT
jgi:hypothetical protein